MAKDNKYELNDHESSMRIKDMVRKRLDKDPLRQEICKKVDEFNKCKCPVTRDKLRKDVEHMDKIRRQKDIEELR